jgi:hypothetical protein
MKSWLWIVSVFGLVITMPAIMLEAQPAYAQTLLAKAEPKPAVEPVVLKCPKCQNDMEEGYFLDRRFRR